jgi:hypothetical protein
VTAEDRDDLELGGHAIWAFLYDENHGTRDDRLRVIRNRFPEARTKTGPGHRRPKHLRAITALTGLGLAFALTACIPVPTDVNIGDPLGPVSVTSVVTAICDNDGYQFRYYGTAETVPAECTIIEPSKTPLLQERGGK